VTAPVDPVHRGQAERWGGWSWREPSRGEHFRTCSYCGCVHPDDLAVESNVRADWADMKYGWPHKFYVDIPNKNPGRQYVLSSAKFQPREGQWLTTADADATLEEILERDGYGKDSRYRPEYFQLGTRKNHFGKFYTTHLADPAISADTKAAIERLGGLRFDFTQDGRVTWRTLGSAQH
jgi:hypothetical protein